MEKNFQIKVKSSGLMFDVEVKGDCCAITNSNGYESIHSKIELFTQINDGKWLKC